MVHQWMEEEECYCKLVLVGDSRSGKTSLVHRFLSDKFAELYTPTGFERYTVTYCVGGYRIHYTLWDTSGTSAYDTVRPLAYQDANVFLLCFQIGNPETLDNTLNKWYPEIRQHSANIPVILCGCQSDLRSDAETLCKLAKMKSAPVTSEQALGVSRQIHATTYVETSSRVCSRSTRDAFEIAALAALGKLNKNNCVALQRNAAAMSTSAAANRLKYNRSKVELKDEKTRNCALM